MKQNHNYRVTYKIVHEHNGIRGNKVPKGWGATDALFAASILYPEDGSLSIYFLSKDGRTGKELSDNEWFKVWAMLTNRLLESKTLPTTAHKVLELCWKIILKSVLA